jgi:hypothetical protein
LSSHKAHRALFLTTLWSFLGIDRASTLIGCAAPVVTNASGTRDAVPDRHSDHSLRSASLKDF